MMEKGRSANILMMQNYLISGNGGLTHE